MALHFTPGVRRNPRAESTDRYGKNGGYAALDLNGALLANVTMSDGTTANANGKIVFGPLLADYNYAALHIGQDTPTAANATLLAYGGSTNPFAIFNAPGATGLIYFRASNITQAQVSTAGFLAKNFVVDAGNFRVAATTGDISITNTVASSFATIILDGMGGAAFRLRRAGVSLQSLFCGFSSATTSEVYNHTANTTQLRFNADNTSLFMGGLAIGNGTTILQVLSAATAKDFGSTAAGQSSEQTISVTGAAVGDPVFLGLPAAPDANSGFTAWVSAANTVTVRFHNYSGSPIDPASGTYRVVVFKF